TGRMAPRHLLAEVDALDEGRRDAEDVDVDAKRAGRDDDRVQPLPLDVVPDELRVLQAEGGRGADRPAGSERLGEVDELLGVERVGDPAPTAHVDPGL